MSLRKQISSALLLLTAACGSEQPIDFPNGQSPTGGSGNDAVHGGLPASNPGAIGGYVGPGATPGPSPAPAPVAAASGGPCAGLSVNVLQHTVAPPASIALLVKVTDCKQQPLGHPLDANAFELREDGAADSPLEASRAITPAFRQVSEHVALLLDLSGSISRANLRPVMVDAAGQLLSHLGPGISVAVYGFDGRPDLVVFTDFTRDPAIIAAALAMAKDAPLVDESTNLNGAVLSALNNLDRAVTADSQGASLSHGALIAFTDGRDLAGRVPDAAVASALDHTADTTFALGLGTDIDDASLARIGRTGRFSSGDAAGLASAYAQIASAELAGAATEYVIGYCSPARAGQHSLSVIVHDGDRSGTATLPYVADGFGPGCTPATSIAAQ